MEQLQEAEGGKMTYGTKLTRLVPHKIAQNGPSRTSDGRLGT